MHEVEKVIQDKEYYEKLLTEYTFELRERSNKEYIKKFAEFRKFPIEAVEESKIFYVEDASDMLLPKYLNYIEAFGIISELNRKPMFSHRYIIPIFNEKGMVQNLVGYSPDSLERYIYAKARYYRRRDTLYGLENLNLAYDLGYAIVVEGITDAIRLRSMGYKNTFAMCGTHSSEYITRQLNRCRHGVIRIPDRDRAGRKAVQGWDFNRHVTIYIYLNYKDVDEMCAESEENRQWFKGYLDGCINWILSGTHNGHKCACEEVTVL